MNKEPLNQVEILFHGIENLPIEDSLLEYIQWILQRLEIQRWEFSLTLTEDRYMAELNEQWRGKKGTTDVLTFVMDEGEEIPHPEALHHPGDLVISLEQVARQAPDFDQSREKELKRVILHGILHLKGMTHDQGDWSKGMLKLQEDLLKECESIEITGWDDGLV